MKNENMTQEKIKKDNLWKKAFRKFLRDKMGVMSLIIVAVYAMIAIAATFGWIASDWGVGHDYGRNAPQDSGHLFGTNKIGQDVLSRGLYSTKVAFEVGIFVAVIATALGGIIGCIAGYFSGSWIDELMLWIIGCLDCIPFYLFVAAIGFVMKGMYLAMHVAMIATFWTATARLIRGEVIKLKHLEFVEAAIAIGVPRIKIIFKHIFPNTFHILLVQATIAFVSAIKSEVILSYLGLGIKEGVSWGIMLSEAASEVAGGTYNNFLVASLFLFVLVMAFNIFADALQDALDPKKVS